MKEISGVYKITNKITEDFYIGSSKNIEKRWANHKCISSWAHLPNNPLYLDFQKYGLENFTFEIMEETTNLREREQYFIDLLRPTYNNYRASGHDEERYAESNRKASKEWQKKYRQTEKVKESYRKASTKYYNHLCLYEGETLRLGTLIMRFQRKGIPHPALEAKKYLLEN